MPKISLRRPLSFVYFVVVLSVMTPAMIHAESQSESHDTRTINVNWSVMQAMVSSRVQPRYPDQAKATHVSGKVNLEVLVDPKGNVQSIKPMDGPEKLRQAAIDCVLQWKFRPYLLNGNPVYVRTQVPIFFFLTK